MARHVVRLRRNEPRYLARLGDFATTWDVLVDERVVATFTSPYLAAASAEDWRSGLRAEASHG